jgi:hypothetical protein
MTVETRFTTSECSSDAWLVRVVQLQSVAATAQCTVNQSWARHNAAELPCRVSNSSR